MSSDRLLIDSDILLRLSGSGILEDTVNTLGFDMSSVFYLRAFPYMLKKSRKFAHIPPDIKHVALNACKQLSPMPEGEPLDAKTESELRQVQYIDSGEAAIYSLMYRESVYYMATGDKKCMKALSQASSVIHIRNAIAGRVICLEKVCLELIADYSVPTVARALAPFISEHKSLSIYFSKANTVNPTLCIQAIANGFQRLRDDVGDDFL
jgi:hypothetical protein